MSAEICKTCKHYTISKRGTHGCQARGRADSGEYGSFDVGARCFHDIALLDDLYSPTNKETDKMTELAKNNDKLRTDLFQLKQEIKNLEQVVYDMTQRGCK